MSDQTALAERKRLAKEILVALSRGQHDKVKILRSVYRELLEVKPEVPSEPKVKPSPINWMPM